MRLRQIFFFAIASFHSFLLLLLQDRREMFCITDPDLYDNPIGENAHAVVF